MLIQPEISNSHLEQLPKHIIFDVPTLLPVIKKHTHISCPVAGCPWCGVGHTPATRGALLPPGGPM